MNISKDAIASIKKMTREQFEALGRKAYREKESPKIQKLVYFKLCELKEKFLKDNGFDAIKEKDKIRNEILDKMGIL